VGGKKKTKSPLKRVKKNRVEKHSLNDVLPRKVPRTRRVKREVHKKSSIEGEEKNAEGKNCWGTL